MSKETQLITAGVEVSVETYFQPDLSSPLTHEFMFAYRITISNLNNFPVQLISRSWKIIDANLHFRLVDGDGVVGEQPILEPNTFYTYTSGCNLKTEIGKMSGHYKFKNLNTQKEFIVEIPSFKLLANFKLN